MNTASVVESWASDIMGQYTNGEIPEVDREFVRAVLLAAGTLEKPMPNLAVNVLDSGACYDVTIKGYKRLIKVVELANLFRGASRDPMLNHVVDLMIQPNDQGSTVLVVQVEKMQFNTRNKKAEERGDEDDDDHVVKRDKRKTKDKRSRWD